MNRSLRVATAWQKVALSGSIFATFLVVVAARSESSDPPGSARMRPPMAHAPGATAIGFLGVVVREVHVAQPGRAPFQAVEILRVDQGSPAAQAHLAVGDLLVWANGVQVTSAERLVNVITGAGGRAQLSIIRRQTWLDVSLTLIEIGRAGNGPRSGPAEPPHYGPTTGTHSGRPPHLSGGGGYAYSPPHADVRPPYGQWPASSPQAPAKYAPFPQAPAKTAPQAVVPAPGTDGPPREVPKDGPPPIPVDMPTFPWPPPQPSSRVEVPARLVHTPGTVESLRAVAGRLEEAFRRAGYAELSYYAIPGGFAVATRLEQFADDGSPLPGPERWSREVVPPRVFGLGSYFQALFRATPGRFRIIVVAVTPDAFREDERVRVSRDEAIEWVKRGFNKLPRAYDRIPYTDEHTCTALIYEFEKAAADDPAVLKDPGLSAETHLRKSNILGGLSP